VNHWATTYIGEPYVWAENDCWAFCRRVWAEQFGLTVPAVAMSGSNLRAITREISHNDERANWSQVDTPAEGDAVLMAHGRYPSHVGIWIDADGGGVLHCIDPQGVVFSTRAGLDRAGWRRVAYYRRAAP
jgi:cell wall-associated NlpC family hydrolase